MDAQGGVFPLGNSLIIWTTLLLLYTSLFVAVRTWAKWQQQWSWADGVFLAGYVSLGNFAVLLFMSTTLTYSTVVSSTCAVHCDLFDCVQV